MREFWLLLSIARAKWPWLALGLLCSVLTLLTNIAMLTVATWFLASMALAGISGVFSTTFFRPLLSEPWPSCAALVAMPNVY